MANSKLKGQIFTIPDELLSKLKSILNSFNGNESTKGYSRLKNLVDNGELSYEQMKRIKHFFDYAKPDDNITEYRLNGGESMKKWVDDNLNGEREKIDHHKEIRKDQGEKNMYRKEHTKSKPLNRDYLMDKLNLDENRIKDVLRINKRLND